MADNQKSYEVYGTLSQVPDDDPQETQEWYDSLDRLIEEKGETRARYMLSYLIDEARRRGLNIAKENTTDYINTIPVNKEVDYPGDEKLERTYRRWIRWNAAVMVTRAQRPGLEVGGHISTYASIATLYEVGLNHFFRGKDESDGGDHVYFQGHASPGNYARAYLEGRLTEADLDAFRQQVSKNGLPSYPHPKQMDTFWEFPTVSLGIGPVNGIYQAWFDRYLQYRGIKDTSKQHTWVFVGDGEMDEVETRGLLQLAATQNLDNLTFVVNCNLQRLDGPVRGNGKIIQELESFFKGAGWNVIKVIWGSEWDQLLSKDKDHALVNLMNHTQDGDYQTYKANDGAYIREHFFGRDPLTKKMVENWTDEEIWNLKRGGHDYRKVYSAYYKALQHKGQPTVILAHTIKGYLLGSHFAGRNATHQMKKLTLEDAKNLRDELRIPLTDEQLEENPKAPPYYRPEPTDPAMSYMLERRRALGGFLPERRNLEPTWDSIPDKPFSSLFKGSGSQKVASTMAFTKILRDLLRDPQIGRYIVPIIPDEARTFGLDSIFPSAKIFNTNGQKYTSVDANMMLSYKEATDGQIMHTGITETGSTAAFTAVGTSYATHGIPMVPFYIFYSMFGFQRTGDQFWAAADVLARGFIMGATAGRTTLTGEGLQHLDGHSHLLAGTNKAVIAYDPAYSYEIAHIIKSGLHRMYGSDSTLDRNVMYYITIYNEPMHQPPQPEDVDVDGIIRGIYQLADHSGVGHKAQLLASGVAVPWALKAKELLANDWGVDAKVWSVTSWNELRKEAVQCDQHNFLHPNEPAQVSYLTQKLYGNEGPFVATSDWDNLVADQIRQWVPGLYLTLGTDGFGVSDTRAAARRYFHVDAESLTVRVLQGLSMQGVLDPSIVEQASKKYGL